jgi:hypothetical protein
VSRRVDEKDDENNDEKDDEKEGGEKDDEKEGGEKEGDKKEDAEKEDAEHEKQNVRVFGWSRKQLFNKQRLALLDPAFEAQNRHLQTPAIKRLQRHTMPNKTCSARLRWYPRLPLYTSIRTKGSLARAAALAYFMDGDEEHSTVLISPSPWQTQRVAQTELASSPAWNELRVHQLLIESKPDANRVNWNPRFCAYEMRDWKETRRFCAALFRTCMDEGALVIDAALVAHKACRKLHRANPCMFYDTDDNIVHTAKSLRRYARTVSHKVKSGNTDVSLL